MHSESVATQNLSLSNKGAQENANLPTQLKPMASPAPPPPALRRHVCASDVLWHTHALPPCARSSPGVTELLAPPQTRHAVGRTRGPAADMARHAVGSGTSSARLHGGPSPSNSSTVVETWGGGTGHDMDLWRRGGTPLNAGRKQPHGRRVADSGRGGGPRATRMTQRDGGTTHFCVACCPRPKMSVVFVYLVGGCFYIVYHLFLGMGLALPILLETVLEHDERMLA